MIVSGCETVSPAMLVTFNVNVTGAVSAPDETACPLFTDPSPAIWPVPKVKTGVMVVDPP